jgi:hypothetical protein
LGRSAELDLLGEIADEMGPEGRVWLVRRLAKSLGVSVNGTLSRKLLGAEADV